MILCWTSELGQETCNNFSSFSRKGLKWGINLTVLSLHCPWHEWCWSFYHLLSLNTFFLFWMKCNQHTCRRRGKECLLTCDDQLFVHSHSSGALDWTDSFYIHNHFVTWNLWSKPKKCSSALGTRMKREKHSSNHKSNIYQLAPFSLIKF